MAEDRDDVTVELLGQKVELTGKVMPNGETRRRVRLGDVAMHLTTTTIGGWQEAHFHKGLRETQVVVEGCMAVVWQDDDGYAQHVKKYSPGGVYTSVPGECHNVYLYAGTCLATTTYGTPVGNPEKKGNDWWPADSGFNEWSKKLSEAEIQRLAG